MSLKGWKILHTRVQKFVNNTKIYSVLIVVTFIK